MVPMLSSQRLGILRASALSPYTRMPISSLLLPWNTLLEHATKGLSGSLDLVDRHPLVYVTVTAHSPLSFFVVILLIALGLIVYLGCTT